MTRHTKFPLFKPDLDIIKHAAPDQPVRYRVVSSVDGDVFEFSEAEAFLCRLLDGLTPLTIVQERFLEEFDVPIDLAQLAAFVRQLHDYNLVDLPGGIPSSPSVWDKMGQLPIPADRLFGILSGLLGWLFSTFGRIQLLVLLLPAAAVLFSHGEQIVFAIRHLPETIRDLSLSDGPPGVSVTRVALILIVIPIVREIGKGIACRYYGGYVPAIHYTWIMRLIPRIVADIRSVVAIPSERDRMRVATAGIHCELLILAIATVGWEMQRLETPLKAFFLSLSVASAISVLLNIMPFGTQDGCLLVSSWLNVPDLRRRAVRLGRAWLFFRPSPEPLPPRQRRWFRCFGILADAYFVTLNVVVFWVLAYLLIGWFEGAGAILFLALLALQIDNVLGEITMGKVTSIIWRIIRWLVGLSILALLAFASLLPYQGEISGDFRVRPFDQREVRADIASQIEAILATEGQRVTEDQVLARLSARQIQRELDTTAAALSREENQLQVLLEGAKPEEIAAAEQRVTLAATRLGHRTRNFNRADGLFEKGHISDEERDVALKQMELDREALELERRNLGVVKSGATEAEIDSQRAEIQRLQSSLDHLKDDLEKTTIKSPMDGMITSLYLEGKAGEHVSIGDVLALVADTTTVTLRIAVPEERVGQIRIGSPVRARTWAYPDTILEGAVTAIAPIVIDRSEDLRRQATMEQSRNMVRSLNAPVENVVPVLVELPNEDGLLKTDMSGVAKIEVETKPLGLVVIDPVYRFFQVRVWSWIP